MIRQPHRNSLRRRVLTTFITIACVMGLGTITASFLLLNQTIIQFCITVAVVIGINGIVCWIYWMVVTHWTASVDLALARSMRREHELDGLRDGFLRAVSHELRTPLTSIIGFMDLIMRGSAGPITSKQAELLKITLTEAHKLKSLFDDLLDVTRITAGQITPTFSPVYIAELAQNIVETLQANAIRKGLTLSVQHPPQSLVIEADAALTRRILHNLTENAIKFTESGSVTFAFESLESMILVKVVDTGIGLKPNQLDIVFDTFRQIDYSSTRQYEGLGLGLSIVKLLAELQGGRVWVESEFGHGATFVVALPVKQQEKSE